MADAGERTMNALIFGCIGDGKSMLVNTLTCQNEKGKRALPGNTTRGVTKDVEFYPLKREYKRELNLTEGFFGDTPGLGDQDINIGKVIGMVEELLTKGNVQIHAIILTMVAGSRVKPDARLISAILKNAFCKNKDQIIVAVTQCDRLSRREKRQFLANVTVDMQELLQTNQVTVVPVSIPPLDTDDDETANLPDVNDPKFDISQLVEALNSRVYVKMNITDPKINECVADHVKTFTDNPEDIDAVRKEIASLQKEIAQARAAGRAEAAEELHRYAQQAQPGRSTSSDIFGVKLGPLEFGIGSGGVKLGVDTNDCTIS